MEIDAVLNCIGECVHDERVRAGFTLDQLARRAELSTAHLSRIESGNRQPSVAALIALSRALSVSVSTLLGESNEGPALSVYTAGKPTREVNGLLLSGCSGYPGSSMLEALHVAIDPKRVPPEYARHRGEEWVYVLSGTLRLECGEETHLLKVGSSAHFDAELAHRLGAEEQATEVLVVAADSLKELHRPRFSRRKALSPK